MKRVVREHHSDLVLDTENVWEVQRYLDHQQVDHRREPQDQVGRIAVAAHSAHRPPQRKRGARDHHQLEHRQRPVGQRERATEMDERGRVLTREIAERLRDGRRKSGCTATFL